jgi:hypothetical protein
MKQKKILGLAGLLLVAYYSWLIFGSGDWFFTHSKNAPNRVAMLKIREGIQLGDGYESVLKNYWQHAPTDLSLFAGSSETWTVSTPLELGARNWVLFIQFAEGKVSAVKVRRSDGPPPYDGPADVGG